MLRCIAWFSPTRVMVRTFRAGIQVSNRRRDPSVRVEDHPVDAFDWLAAVRTARFERENRRRGDMHVRLPDVERVRGPSVSCKSVLEASSSARNGDLCGETRAEREKKTGSIPRSWLPIDKENVEGEIKTSLGYNRAGLSWHEPRRTGLGEDASVVDVINRSVEYLRASNSKCCQKYTIASEANTPLLQLQNVHRNTATTQQRTMATTMMKASLSKPFLAARKPSKIASRGNAARIVARAGKRTSKKETKVAGRPAFADLMSFSGPAPELINGRLAMLGMSTAILLEPKTGETALALARDYPLTIGVLFALFTFATFVPLRKKETPESKSTGIFTAQAELINGRAAMLGFASLLAVEASKHAAFF